MGVGLDRMTSGYGGMIILNFQESQDEEKLLRKLLKKMEEHYRVYESKKK